MSEWQSIETAPKDGTWILLYFTNGCWQAESGMIVGFWSNEYGHWYNSEASSHPLEAFEEYPTHWMPLPEPPQ